MWTALWVGLGGALGSIARYGIGAWIGRRSTTFPWGTLVVNVLGSLLLGIVVTLALRGRIGETTRLALGTGVLGGFTTYSTFNYETIALAQAGHLGRAALYVLVTLAGALVGGVVGVVLARA